jgi:hypothetical protein
MGDNTVLDMHARQVFLCLDKIAMRLSQVQHSTQEFRYANRTTICTKLTAHVMRAIYRPPQPLSRGFTQTRSASELSDTKNNQPTNQVFRRTSHSQYYKTTNQKRNAQSKCFSLVVAGAASLPYSHGASSRTANERFHFHRF